MTAVSPFNLIIRETSAMPIRHPVSGDVLTMPDGSPQTITLAGLDSLQFRRALNEVGQPAENDLEAAADWAARLVAACITDWAVLGEDGKPAEYSAEAALTLMRRCPWLRVQCDEHMASRERYLGEP
jgi:hypothetical protein